MKSRELHKPNLNFDMLNLQADKKGHHNLTIPKTKVSREIFTELLQYSQGQQQSSTGSLVHSCLQYPIPLLMAAWGLLTLMN